MCIPAIFGHPGTKHFYPSKLDTVVSYGGLSLTVSLKTEAESSIHMPESTIIFLGKNLKLKAYSGSYYIISPLWEAAVAFTLHIKPFFLSKLALKSTYSNVEFQKFSGRDPRAPTSIDPLPRCHNVQVFLFCLQLAL